MIKICTDVQINEVLHLPYLDNHLPNIGLLQFHPVSDFMSQEVTTLYEVNKAGEVHDMLSSCDHNGFPVVAKNGQLRG